MIESLGRALTTNEAAQMLGLPKHQLITNPGKFGGVRISQKRTVFYEKLIVEAIRRMHADQTKGPEGAGNTESVFDSLRMPRICNTSRHIIADASPKKVSQKVSHKRTIITRAVDDLHDTGFVSSTFSPTK